MNCERTIKFQSLKYQSKRKVDEVIYSFNGDMNESFDHTKVPRLIKNKITLVLKDLRLSTQFGTE